MSKDDFIRPTSANTDNLSESRDRLGDKNDLDMTNQGVGGGKKPNDKDNKDDKDKDKKSKDDGEDKSLFEKDKKNKLTNNLKKIAATKAGMAGAKMGITYLIVKRLLALLKMLMEAIKSAALGLWASAVHAVTSFFSSLGITISNAAAAAIVLAVPGLAASVIAGAIVYNIANNIQKLDDILPCKVAVEEAIEGTTGNSNVSDKKRLEVAGKIYSVFHKLGLPDVHISGILGNFQAESQLDPTCIEGIYNEPYTIGPRHKEALKDLNGWCVNYLFPKYRRGNTNFTAEGYRIDKRHGGQYWPGVGLGQWTGGDTSTALFDFAKANNKNWYDLDIQIAYMLARDTRADRRIWVTQTWKNTKLSSPREAAYQFAKKWEGNTKNGMPERYKRAEEWYNAIKNGLLKNDEQYADSLIAFSKVAVSGADSAGIDSALANCQTATNVDNSTLAKALVEYAYPTQEQGYNNDGTELYRSVKRQIFPGDNLFQSCDRSVSTAIRWSGTDIEFPIGSTSVQLAYLKTSPKWTKIEWGGNIKMLKPGDVLIMSQPDSDRLLSGTRHITAYVGEEIIKQKYGNQAKPGSNTVSGSIGGPPRSPGCGKIYSKEYKFYAYRCTKPDNSDKYRNLR